MPRLALELGGEVGDIGRRLGDPLRPRVGRALRVAERAGGVAGRPLVAVGNHVGHLRGAVPAVLVVGVLDDLFASSGLNIDVDVRRAFAVR